MTAERTDGGPDDGGPDDESPTDPDPSTERNRPTDHGRSTDPRNTPTMTDTRSEPTADPSAVSDGGTEPTNTEAAATNTEPAGADARTGDGDGPRFARLSSGDLRGLIDRVGLAALVLLALIAGWSFYSQTGRAIRTWLDPAYHPIALAAFNLAVLFVALAGVTHQLYRIRDDADGDGG